MGLLDESKCALGDWYWRSRPQNLMISHGLKYLEFIVSISISLFLKVHALTNVSVSSSLMFAIHALSWLPIETNLRLTNRLCVRGPINTPSGLTYAAFFLTVANAREIVAITPTARVCEWFASVRLEVIPDSLELLITASSFNVFRTIPTITIVQTDV